MDSKTLAVLNLLALVALYVTFIPFHSQIAQGLILVVAVLLLLRK